jgi:cation diffusion facilitator family transporter
MTNAGIDTRKQKAARWSVVSALTFIVLKLIVWRLSGSVSVLAEAIHSSSDLLGSTLALVSVWLADRAPDETHTYGHGKFENVSGMFISLMILFAGGMAIREAIGHLHRTTPLHDVVPAVTVMALSALANAAVSRNLLKVGKLTDSPALTADGLHLQSDIFTALSVVVGLILVSFTGRVWIDPCVALIVSALVLWLGFRVARDSLVTLSDASLPENEEDVLRQVLVKDSRVLGYHKLRTRKSGSHRYVDVHVQLSDSLSFVEAHKETEEIEDNLRAALRNLHVIIHVEPYSEEEEHQRKFHADDPAI